MRRFIAYSPALLLLVAVIASTLLAPVIARRVGFAQTEARIQLARLTLDDDDILERISHATQAVADLVRPSVVHLDVITRNGRRRGVGGGVGASGSAWIYDAAGHVVTNAHVVRGGVKVTAELSDGRVYTLERVGVDQFTDIAVLKLPTTAGIVPVSRATGELPRQGERVYAFGSPFGFKFSMSEGMISALGRDPRGAVVLSQGFTNYIQTDAAVNPGNSGGPLVDVLGRVVGMNVAIATGSESEGTTTGQSAGISFAIPLRTIESVVDQLIERGEVRRGFLGVGLPPNSREPIPDREAYNGFGMSIPSVTEGGPAERAGLQASDIILSVDGQIITGVNVLRSQISNSQPGEGVEIEYIRDGVRRTTEVVLAEFPEENIASVPALQELIRLGLAVDAPDGVIPDGVIVVGIEPGSSADKAGFVVGQIITEVNNKRVGNGLRFASELASSGLLAGQDVRFTVRAEDGQTMGLTLRSR